MGTNADGSDAALSEAGTSEADVSDATLSEARASEADAEDAPDTPKFRGCVFCYGAEWGYYGAKKGIRAVRE